MCTEYILCILNQPYRTFQLLFIPVRNDYRCCLVATITRSINLRNDDTAKSSLFRLGRIFRVKPSANIAKETEALFAGLVQTVKEIFPSASVLNLTTCISHLLSSTYFSCSYSSNFVFLTILCLRVHIWKSKKCYLFSLIGGLWV